jgi:hypothetical protein
MYQIKLNSLPFKADSPAVLAFYSDMNVFGTPVAGDHYLSFTSDGKAIQHVTGMCITRGDITSVYTELGEALAAVEALEMDDDHFYYRYLPSCSRLGDNRHSVWIMSVYRWVMQTYQLDQDVSWSDSLKLPLSYVFYDGPLKGKQLLPEQVESLSDREAMPKHFLAPNNLRIEYRDDYLVDDCLQGWSENPEEFHSLPFIYLHGELEDSNLEEYTAGDNDCAPDLAMSNLTVRDITELAKKQEGVIDIDQEGLTSEIECEAKGEPALCVVSYDVCAKVLHGRVAWLKDAKGLAHAKDVSNWR